MKVKCALLFTNVMAFILLFLVIMQVLSFYDTKYADKDKLHGDFSLVCLSGDGHFYRLKLADLGRLKCELPPLVSEKLSGEVRNKDAEVFSYDIVKESGGSFLVNTRWKDDDRTVWSRYRVVNNEVIPIKSRLYAFDYMPVAVILAFLGTYFLSWLLKRLVVKKL